MVKIYVVLFVSTVAVWVMACDWLHSD